ncbi:MAG: 50S ribosomal protein L18 [Candidatus Kerfeldbacteria bacterium]|nr:50S ribosomal protein L18 [Candidatus Kerfeldbacteria bacterium]
MTKTLSPHLSRLRRHRRVRAAVIGAANRPRLAVYRSSKHLQAQLINDETQTTLVAVSDVGVQKSGNKTERATALGKQLAEQALAKKISRVVFDRGGYRYHGRVKALADAARAAGLQF